MPHLDRGRREAEHRHPRRALKDDYKLSVALNGETALQVTEKSPPDLVLLDIMMPGSMATKFAAAFAKCPQWPTCPWFSSPRSMRCRQGARL
jgi:response regulator RpfG family c-di-GMP phosphodiesterase